MGDEDVAEELLNAISTLAGNCLENRNLLRAAEADGAVLRVLAKHEKVEAVAEAGVAAIANLVHGTLETGTPQSEDLTDGVSLASHGSSRAEHDSLLINEPQRDAIIEKIVLAVVRSDGCKIIARALQRHASVQRIAELGCRALADIAIYGFSPEDRLHSLEVAGPLAGAGGAVGCGSGSGKLHFSGAAKTTGPGRGSGKSRGKVLSIEAMTNRRLVGASPKAEDRYLLPLGQSPAPAALSGVLRAHLADTAVVQWALLALDRMSACNRNIPALHAAGLDSLLVLVLRSHYQHSASIVNLCYRLMVHFSVLDASRNLIGLKGGGEMLLLSLSYNTSDPLRAKLGCDAISALCMSPQYDAIASMSSKDTLALASNAEYHEMDGGGGGGGQQDEGAFGGRQRSRSNSWEGDGAGGGGKIGLDGSSAATSSASGGSRGTGGPMGRRLSSMFGWGSSGSGSGASASDSSVSAGAVSGSGSGASAGASSDAASPVRIPVTTFEVMSAKCGGGAGQGGSSGLLGGSGGGSGGGGGAGGGSGSSSSGMGSTSASSTASSLLGYTAGSLVSKGLTDQEEEMHLAKALALSKKTNTSVLVSHGATKILLALMEKHFSSFPLQISAVNAVNSLALSAGQRAELNREHLFDALVKTFRDCLMRNRQDALDESSSSSTAAAGSVFVGAGAEEDGSSYPSTPVLAGAIPTAAASAASASALVGHELDDDFQLEDDKDKPLARRALLVALALCFGTLCLPLPEEMEGLVPASDSWFATESQEYLGRRGVCELLTECLASYSRVSACVCRFLPSFFFFLFLLCDFWECFVFLYVLLCFVVSFCFVQYQF
jgi:hypothetical protein